MLETTTSQLTQHLQRQFPANRAYSRDELTNPPPEMPQAIAHYLICCIDAQTAQPLNQLEANTWVDANDPSVQNLLQQMRGALNTAARVPTDAWPRALAEAVQQVVPYLIHPVDTLSQRVFKNEATCPVEVISREMAYFSPYSYLHSVFGAYVERKSLTQLDQNRFEQVLRRVDRQMVADYTAPQWKKLFQPLFDVVGLCSSGPVPQVTTSLLQQLAANKQFDQLVDQLDQLGSSAVSMDRLTQCIATALDGPPEPAEPSGPAPITEKPQPSAPNTAPVEESSPQPRWKRFQQPKSSSKPSSPPPKKPKPSPQRPSPEDNKDDGRPLWQKFHKNDDPKKPSAGSTNPSPGPEVNTASASLTQLERSVLGTVAEAQRHTFIKHLFQGSRDQYVQILNELQQLNSWERASSVIAQKVFLPYQVNIYSDPAVAFTDLVETRYRQSAN